MIVKNTLLYSHFILILLGCAFILVSFWVVLIQLDNFHIALLNYPNSSRDLPEYSSNEINKSGPKLVCYYTLNGTHLTPEKIDTSLCTHIIAGFAGVNASNFHLVLDEEKIKILTTLRNMTLSEKGLNLMLTVGGAGLSGFSAIVTNHTSRLTFIRSLMVAVKEYYLDGVDIDWEWPVLDGGKREKVQFIQFLQEIRTEFKRHKKKYVLSAAVAAVESIIDASYYVRHLAEQVDFVNVMSYDYHFFTKVFPITDYNAPLFPDPEDIGGVLENLNVNYTILYWIQAGMPQEKIMLGVPTYGHTFRLRSSANNGRHAPAVGFGLGDGGYINYEDSCKFKNSKWDRFGKVPYASQNHDWISYDDRLSVSLKTKLAMNYHLGGIMVYSLNADDYNGYCQQGETFPLVRTIRKRLFGN